MAAAFSSRAWRISACMTSSFFAGDMARRISYSSVRSGSMLVMSSPLRVSAKKDYACEGAQGASPILIYCLLSRSRGSSRLLREASESYPCSTHGLSLYMRSSIQNMCFRNIPRPYRNGPNEASKLSTIRGVDNRTTSPALPSVMCSVSSTRLASSISGKTADPP